MTIMRETVPLAKTVPLEPSDSVPDSQTSQPQDGIESSHSFLSDALRENFGVLKKRKLSPQDTTCLAQETQAMINREVRRMKNAVSELEAYLQNVEAASAEGRDLAQPQANDASDGVVVVVPPDDDDDDETEDHQASLRRLAREDENRFPSLPVLINSQTLTRVESSSKTSLNG